MALRTRTITDSRLSATGRPARVKIATMLSPTTGMPLPSAHETRTRVIAPMKRARGAGPLARATADKGRNPKSAYRNEAPQTTIPEKITVNPTGAMVSVSTTP